MKSVKVSGKTIEEAVAFAVTQLHAKTKDNIDYNVVEEPKKGFLGLIGSRPALIEARYKPDPAEEAQRFLSRVLEDMGVEIQVVKAESRDREAVFHLYGEEPGVIIGKHGKTLDSLQYLAQLAANRYAKKQMTITLDAENYRQRRRETLEDLAEKLASKAERTGGQVVLEPMPPQERKIIHAALQSNQRIKTYSSGTEPRRYIVIAPA
ncbi:RNA-binding cell elongation regulator Jag/EloR [Salibacterium halotolerans]|uniref:RNA-binding protein KhpB n=1 Tax=Salibacterium halotolerans TaxID=1884432 RepID=A0A1I5U4K6_9BACI|nr:RNA-binding cell elongation regulator Jag/EloR [Salibacterium halotolerans]SFP90205.1 spoIIIJ-associated protein [Salibacterium halotolerans]